MPSFSSRGSHFQHSAQFLKLLIGHVACEKAWAKAVEHDIWHLVLHFHLQDRFSASSTLYKLDEIDRAEEAEDAEKHKDCRTKLNGTPIT